MHLKNITATNTNKSDIFLRVAYSIFNWSEGIKIYDL